MAIDRYTKCLLTVIALCLIWMSLGGPALLPAAQAQAQPAPAEVVLTGWKDSSGVVWRLPTTVLQPAGPFITEAQRRYYETKLANGERLPVAVP